MNTFNSCHLRSRLWRDKSISIWRIFDLHWRIPGRARAGSLRLITLICLFWFGTLALRAANYYVATNGIDGTGLDWGHAASNIQYAVNLAIAPNDTVWVSNGSYCVSNQITITNNITVRGLNGWTNTIVYADSAYTNTRCFYVYGSGIVDGFTITNGHYQGSNAYIGGGGALLSTGTIQNCYFVNNICSNNMPDAGGGAIYVKYAGTVSNCTFISNTYYSYPVGQAATDHMGGGAINIFNNANVLKCIISKNKTAGSYGRGGGIYARAGSALISNCTFNANEAVAVGVAFILYGGHHVTDCIITNHTMASDTVICYGSTMRNCLIENNSYGRILYIANGGMATNCTVVGNKLSQSSASTYGCVGIRASAGYSIPVLEGCVLSNNICSSGAGGGAVSITVGGILRNCLIHHNTNTSSIGYGGGVLLTNAAAGSLISWLYNCTIVNNYSTNEGGGTCAMGPSNYIVNCIIAGNSSSSGNYPNVYHRDDPDANKSNYYYSCVITAGTYLAENQGNITNDPVFAGASDWRLAANSPCVNKGTNISWMTNSCDLDGRTRIRYGTVDMGAYERLHDGTIYDFR